MLQQATSAGMLGCEDYRKIVSPDCLQFGCVPTVRAAALLPGAFQRPGEEGKPQRRRNSASQGEHINNSLNSFHGGSGRDDCGTAWDCRVYRRCYKICFGITREPCPCSGGPLVH